jgi:hypothetical protein
VGKALAAVVVLNALYKDLAKLSDPRSGDLAKALVQAGVDAMTPIANAVRTAYPHKTGHLAGSVKVTKSRTGAAVRVGSKVKIPYAGPVDFGGYPDGRPFLADGRYLYPTAKAMLPQAIHDYEAAIVHVCETFPWTNSTTSAGSVHD